MHLSVCYVIVNGVAGEGRVFCTNVLPLREFQKPNNFLKAALPVDWSHRPQCIIVLLIEQGYIKEDSIRKVRQYVTTNGFHTFFNQNHLMLTVSNADAMWI